MLKNLKNKKILILGLGREGLSTYKILRRLFPRNIIGLADQSLKPLNLETFKLDSQVELHLGPNYLESLKDYDVIIKSPGIPHFPEIVKAKKQGKLTSQIKIFFENCPGTIVGVTGTKGKGTTASLIFRILKNYQAGEMAGGGRWMASIAGVPAEGGDGGKRPTGPACAKATVGQVGPRRVFLAGNIGTPVLDLLSRVKKNDFLVLELSSHQLADLEQSPHIAVFLNLFPEHQDYYKNIQAYARAKANILKFQTPRDYLIYNTSDRRLVRLTKNSKAQKISFSLTDKTANLYPYKGYLHFQSSPIIPISLIILIGRFNLNNVMAAIAVAKILKIPNQIINKAIATFKPLPHRLERVGTYRGITFYNDSLATNPQATVAAIQAFNEKYTQAGGGRWGVFFGGKRDSLPAEGSGAEQDREGRVERPGPEAGTRQQIATLIAGGYDRGKTDFKPLTKAILKAKIKNLILFPTTGQKIWQATKKQSRGSDPMQRKPQSYFVNNMEEAVKLVYQHTPPGTTCLLSCASPSFGIFKDYADRGNQFKKFVKEFAKVETLEIRH